MLTSSLSSHAAEQVISVLNLVLQDGKPLDRAYSLTFSGQRLLPAEQARITQVGGDIMRKLNLYCFLAGITPQEMTYKGAYLLSVWHKFHELELPKFSYCQPIDEADYQARLEKAKLDLVLWDGCPEWLNNLGMEQLGDDWLQERAALATAPKRYLRCNTLKCSLSELKEALAEEDVETNIVDGVDSALEVTSDSALFRTECFKKGWFEQQDAGSQLIADALDAKSGMRVIDACAGAGGKTLHIAAKMQGKGRLLAMDIEPWKLDNLKERAKRAAAFNVETRLITSSKTIKRLKLSADRLLLDVPCSGLGVLKRNPDTKWRDTAERLPVLVALQADILTRYSKMLKVDGVMIYATCSIMPQENRQQIDAFLANNDNFKLMEDHTIKPSESGFDGFYMAKLTRIAE